MIVLIRLKQSENCYFKIRTNFQKQTPAITRTLSAYGDKMRSPTKIIPMLCTQRQ